MFLASTPFSSNVVQLSSILLPDLSIDTARVRGGYSFRILRNGIQFIDTAQHVHCNIAAFLLINSHITNDFQRVFHVVNHHHGCLPTFRLLLSLLQIVVRTKSKDDGNGRSHHCHQQIPEQRRIAPSVTLLRVYFCFHVAKIRIISEFSINMIGHDDD